MPVFLARLPNTRTPLAVEHEVATKEAWRPAEGYLLGSSVAFVVILIVLIGLFQMQYLWKARIPSWIVISQLIGYGFPIVVIMLMGELLPNLNRYVIFAKLDSCAVARYSIGCMIATLCFQTVYEPLNTILHPRVFRAWEKGSKAESRKIITRYLNLYIIFGLIVFPKASLFFHPIIVLSPLSCKVSVVGAPTLTFLLASSLENARHSGPLSINL